MPVSHMMKGIFQLRFLLPTHVKLHITKVNDPYKLGIFLILSTLGCMASILEGL